MDLLGEGTPESTEKAMEAYANLSIEAEKAGKEIVASNELIQNSLDSTDPTKMVEGFRLAVQQIKASGGEIPESLQQSLLSALNHFDELTPEAQTRAIDMMMAMMDGMSDMIPEFENVSRMSSEEILSTFKEYLVDSGALKNVGVNSMDELAAEIQNSGIPKYAEKIVEETTNEFADLSLGASVEAAKVDPAIMGALAQAGLEGKLSNEGKKALKGFIDGLDGLDSNTREEFEMAVQGALQGLDGFDEIQAKAEKEGTSFLEALADTLEVHSPSRAVEEIFSQVNPGAIEGLDDGKDGLLEKGKGLINEFLETLSGEELGNAGKQAGQKAVSAMSGGIVSGKQLLSASGKEVANTAKQSLGSVKTLDTGKKFGNLFETGINSTKTKNNVAAKGIATLARTAMAAVSTFITGNTFGGQFASGISAKSSVSRASGTTVATAARAAMAAVNVTVTGAATGAQYSSGVQSKSGSARSAGFQLASSARSGATVDGSDLGRNFGQGFANGIASTVQKVVSAASSIASAALAATQRTIDSHSPSKKTGKLGRDYGAGFVNELIRYADIAAKAAGSMGVKAVEGLQGSLQTDELEFDIESTMNRVDDAVWNRIASYASPWKSNPEQKEKSSKEKSGNIYQTVNINQPVKNHVEMSRALRREGRRLAYGK